jgi:caffeoyl-CoA O-methyltransferase
MSDTSINLTPELYRYLLKNSLREPEVLQKLREQTHKMSMSQMQISPEQGQFMALLVQLLNAKKTLDIGVFTGYSALSVALALPSDGQVIACDTNVEWTKIALKYWELANMSHKINLHLAPAKDTLQSLIDNGEAGSFDFAFIDADKVNYPVYYELALKLVRPGGLIAVDNVLWSGKVANPEVMDRDTLILREFNAKLLNDERVSLSMIPMGDGLTLARKA